MQHAATGSSTLYPDAQPYFGVVENTVQALRLVQAAWLGVVPRIIRRLNDTERKEKIVSGAVFIFGVDESGMKRWTDGRLWSPSRIDGNFLVYREMDRKGDGMSKFDRFEEWTPGDDGRAVSSTQEQRQGRFWQSGTTAAENRTANKFKADGLVKKTITVKINGSDHHLICYYTQQDLYMGRFKPMSTRSDIMGLDLSPHIFCFTDFRLPPRLEKGPDGLSTIVCEPETGVRPVPLLNESIGYNPDRPVRTNVPVSYGKSNGTCTSVSILHNAHQMPSIDLGESWQERPDFLQQALPSNSEFPHWSSLTALSAVQREPRPTSQPITHTLTPQYQPQGWPLTHGYHAGQYPSPSVPSNASDIYRLFSQPRDTERALSNNQEFGTRSMSDGGTRHMGKREPVWPSAASDVCHIADSRFPTLECYPSTGRQSVDSAWSLGENAFSQLQHPSVASSNQSIGQNSSLCIQNARLWTMGHDTGWEDGQLI